MNVNSLSYYMALKRRAGDYVSIFQSIIFNMVVLLHWVQSEKKKIVRLLSDSDNASTLIQRRVHDVDNGL